MDLSQQVTEQWNNASTWRGLFTQASYVPVSAWCDEDGAAAPHLDVLIDGLADELSNLRMGATALRDLIASYLEVIANFDTILSELVTSVINEYLRHPPSCHPAFTDDPATFMTGLRATLLSRNLDRHVIDEVMALAPDLFSDLADTIRSSYVYIPDQTERRDQSELAKMTGHFGELIGYLVFRDLRRATCFRTKVIVDDPNGDRPGLDILAFHFDPTDRRNDQVMIIEGKGTRNTVGGMRDAIVQKLTNFDSRPVFYEFERMKAELADPRNVPHPSGLSVDELAKRVTDAWWLVTKRQQLDRAKLCGLIVYSHEHHPPTDRQLAGFADIADDPRRIQILLFPIPRFDETVKAVFERAWKI